MKDKTAVINKAFNHFDIGGKKVHTVNSPEYRASTILFESCEDMLDAGQGKYTGIYYGTNRLPNQRELEESINLLENASITRIFPSGISAIRHTLLAFLKPGDHILVWDNVYGPTKTFCKNFLAKLNIETTFVPPEKSSDIKKYIRKNTKLIFIESPGSITFEVSDIQKTIAAAESKKIITVMDNTWATPIFFKPLDHGIDISVESVTKYISGHCDVLMGSVSLNEKYGDFFDKYCSMAGITNSGHDCITALKGLKTLELRLKEHEKNAFFLASWLEKQEIIDQVLYPPLKSHPNHDLWKKYFKGGSGLFGIIFKDKITQEKITTFINRLKLFGIGFSWGGYKSLISAGKISREESEKLNGKTVIRISAGLEDRNDLKKDLETGLKSII
ncbi:MAG: trans-sulfuration enzyme family protein [Thermodesulfobacteriota bacterium]